MLFFIVLTCLLEIVLILSGEILSWSLMRVKALIKVTGKGLKGLITDSHNSTKARKDHSRLVLYEGKQARNHTNVQASSPLQRKSSFQESCVLLYVVQG